MTQHVHHCSRCGAQLPGAPPIRCLTCGYTLYVNARPCAGVVVVRDDGSFLAGRRAHEPSLGMWDLPGGFCDGWEHPAEAAVREAREEVGIEVTLGPLVGVYVGDYAHQGETLPVLDLYYLATLVSGDPTPDPAEMSEVAWFPLTDPPPLAFPNMDAVVRDAAALWHRKTGGEPG
ncbi:MAG: NUDIX domain-containing protein [Micromonosporaceae bacterium]